VAVDSRAVSNLRVHVTGVRRRPNPVHIRIDARTAWAVADFNGDHRLDLITASSTRNFSGTYTHSIEVALGGSESGSLSFASADAHIRLQVRDVDGDHDADLVVLGAISAKPIDLWINDGAGNFQHGDASRLQTESETPSIEGLESDDDTLATLTDDQNSLAAPRTALWTQDAASGRPPRLAFSIFSPSIAPIFAAAPLPSASTTSLYL